MSLHFIAAKFAQQNEEIPAKVFGEDGIEEGVGTGVDGVEQDQEDLGLGHSDKGNLEGSRDGEEGYGGHAEKVCEDEHGHTLGDLGVTRGRNDIGVPYSEVDVGVAATDDYKGQNIEDKKGHDIELCHGTVNIHGQTNAHLHITADAHDRKEGSSESEEPPYQHDTGSMAELHLAIKLHGVSYGVPPFQRDGCQSVH